MVGAGGVAWLTCLFPASAMIPATSSTTAAAGQFDLLASFGGDRKRGVLAFE
jgi:hypothetical protein